eukprot:GILJ01000280.1.p1 GENE.GILJ01000280.1~~GILJ01000280.1.p1  ORF type:complete len:326 (-),score=29.69 GILJ01000280.1:195-1172(-)
MKLLCVLVVALSVCCALLCAPVSAGGLFEGCDGVRPGKEPGACVIDSPRAEAPVKAPAVHKHVHVPKRHYLDAEEAPRRVHTPTAAEIIEAAPETCKPRSLRAPWGRSCINLSWMTCAANALIGGYHTKIVPAGVMMFHGSRSLPVNTIPNGLGFYSGYQTAKRYAVREGWSKGPTPIAHPFRAKQRFAVVDLMEPRNQAAMQRVLRDAIRDRLHSDLLPSGFDTTYPLRGITSYTGPGGALHRVSIRNHDKYAFTVLCDDWKAKGISGFYGNYDDLEFHPELMLCNDENVIDPVPDYNFRSYTSEELIKLGGKAPNYDAICKAI